MRIAIEGCLHGELDILYNTVKEWFIFYYNLFNYPGNLPGSIHVVLRRLLGNIV